MNWYITALKRYAVFEGRAQRQEYWFFLLFNILISIALSMLDGALVVTGSGIGVLSLIYALAVFLPGLAVTVRRLHDTDRSGWWVLIGLVPVIGSIVLLVFMAIDGTPGPNRFGSNPKDQPVDTAGDASAGETEVQEHRQTLITPVVEEHAAAPPFVTLAGADAEGQTFRVFVDPAMLSRGPVSVGRGADVQVQIEHIQVSRHHLTLDWTGQALQLTDNQSTNGTAINATPVEAGRATRLEAGDRLTLGTLTLDVAFS